MIKHLEKVISFTISIAIIITTGSIPGYFIDITKIEIGLALFCIVMAFIHKIKERDIRKIAILAVFSVVFWYMVWTGSCLPGSLRPVPHGHISRAADTSSLSGRTGAVLRPRI